MPHLTDHPTNGAFASPLLAWWEANGRRDLPWQKPRTPYRVWVSEVMLQQTQVATVVPYFVRFVQRFPDIEALAAAELDPVLHLWSGLGYYARARNLHRTARIVVREHAGVFPATAEEIEALPGIGRSTAAAIVAQAYDRRAPILDGNVKRVLARQHRVAGHITSAVTLAKLWKLADALTPQDRAADYTQAVMDLGATVCRRRPVCTVCPVRTTCQAYASGAVDRYPERATSRPKRLERRRFFVLTTPDGACFVEQRAPEGIWGGLWSPPERPADLSVETFLAHSGFDPGAVREIRAGTDLRHGFSHFDLVAEPIHVRLRTTPPEVRAPPESQESRGRWIVPGQHELGLSAVAAKLLDSITPERGPS